MLQCAVLGIDIFESNMNCQKKIFELLITIFGNIIRRLEKIIFALLLHLHVIPRQK